MFDHRLKGWQSTCWVQNSTSLWMSCGCISRRGGGLFNGWDEEWEFKESPLEMVEK